VLSKPGAGERIEILGLGAFAIRTESWAADDGHDVELVLARFAHEAREGQSVGQMPALAVRPSST
jgi:hypothetical protein